MRQLLDAGPRLRLAAASGSSAARLPADETAMPKVPDSPSPPAASPAVAGPPVASPAVAGPAVDVAQVAALGAIFPALAHLLGPAAFRSLCAGAVLRACTPGAAPGAQVHALLVRREARTDDRLPSRLAADIAAIEWSMHGVAARAAEGAGGQRAWPRDLPPSEAWREVALQPVRAFDLVPVAFRLDVWVRRLHEGRRVTRLPFRGEQHIVVCARPLLPASGDAAPWPGGAPGRAPWLLALPPGAGHLLTRFALGLPLGEAVDDAVRRGWVADEAEARALLDGWLREGLFARVLHPGG